MRKHRLRILSLAIIMLSTACGDQPVSDEDEVATIVAATLGVSNSASDAPAPTAEPAIAPFTNHPIRLPS